MKVTSTHRLKLFVLSPAIRLFVASAACAFVAYCPDAQASPPSAYSYVSVSAEAKAYPSNNWISDSKSLGPVLDWPLGASGNAEDIEEGGSANGSAWATTSLISGGVAAASGICEVTMEGLCNVSANADLIYFVRAKLKPGAQPPMFPTDIPLSIKGEGAGFASGESAFWSASLYTIGTAGTTVTTVFGCTGDLTYCYGQANSPSGNFYIGGAFIIPSASGGSVELTAGVGAMANWTGTSEASAAVDPTIAFDQAAFDAQYGSSSFNLSDYYSIEVSPSISFDPALCSNTPVQLIGTANYYTTISLALPNVTLDGQWILLPAVAITDSPNFNGPYAITLRGGFNCTYTSVIGFTTLHGTLTISGGTVTIENLIVTI